MLTNTHRIMASSLLLLLIGLPVIRADLMCYVCDDCEQLPKDAPLLACNEEFFNPGGSTEASTVTTTTTTEASTTAMSTEETTTPEMTTISAETSPQTTETTTTTPVETTTPEPTTESSQSTESTQSTEAPAPTPPTAGPVQTTTGVPTPPAEDLFFVAAMNATRLVPVESSTPSLAVRQRRAVVDTEVTYHCYSVQVDVNGTMSTNRGCSRVSTYEGVCDLLKIQNNNTELANCNPCSMNACNGGNAVRTSILATLLVAFVAFALQRN
ncbi:cell wall protein DAN4 [Drosophila serrata]|uniref:cell wall protein DAN4 n=1 Tax=Drosophila serrata TaxID=7274 RepID=UPI000A1D3780|nr:cell wall protein DAN4 [Drosophila serrata]